MSKNGLPFLSAKVVAGALNVSRPSRTQIPQEKRSWVEKGLFIGTPTKKKEKSPARQGTGHIKV